jgi:Holliday junction resolvase RusA-like endonuclease
MSILAFSVPGKIIPAVRMPNKTKYSPEGQAYIGYKGVVAAKAKEEIARLSTQTYQPWPIKPVHKTIVDRGRRKRAKLRNVKVFISALTDNVRADADNIAKSVLDALNKVAWGDDSQIGRLVVEVRPLHPGEEEIVMVTITGDE